MCHVVAEVVCERSIPGTAPKGPWGLPVQRFLGRAARSPRSDPHRSLADATGPVRCHLADQ